MYAISKFRGIGEVPIPILQNETKILEQKITDQMMIVRNELESNIEILDRFEREGIPKYIYKIGLFFTQLMESEGEPSIILSIANKDPNLPLDVLKAGLIGPPIILSFIIVKTFFLFNPPVNWKLTNEEKNEKIIQKSQLIFQRDLHETILIKFLAFKWMANDIRVNDPENHIILKDDIIAKVGELLFKIYSSELRDFG
jgi:hypothetical protein